MRIGIDISQLAYSNTGVANYLGSLLESLFIIDKENDYVLFFSSSRGKADTSNFRKCPNVTIKEVKIPPKVLDLIWNKLHILPVESLVGNVDIFLTSDWTEPPTRKAKKVTILYDLTVYKYPEETDKSIIETQKRKLKWVKKESDIILCISEATKKDAEEILGIDKKRLAVIYPGLTL